MDDAPPVQRAVIKIVTGTQWAHLQEQGVWSGSADDIDDGFIHLSTPAQVAGTLARHFADVDDLWLLTLDAAALGDDVRWEVSRGGDLFPHLYRALRLSDVRSAARP